MTKLLSILFFLLCVGPMAGLDLTKIQEGDIIFQDTASEQSEAIKLATKSKYSHVGIIFRYKNIFQVLEAIGPVKITPLREFIQRGNGGHFVIKRLREKQKLMTTEKLIQLKKAGNALLGREYDIYFQWNDKRIYCSELVWKIYKKALNLEIGKLEQMKDFDLSNPKVKKILLQRYGNKIPYQEQIISPEAMFQSKLLTTIQSDI